jgi:hypothetical protein
MKPANTIPATAWRDHLVLQDKLARAQTELAKHQLEAPPALIKAACRRAKVRVIAFYGERP